jgi:hypothetical protein
LPPEQLGFGEKLDVRVPAGFDEQDPLTKFVALKQTGKRASSKVPSTKRMVFAWKLNEGRMPPR